MPYCRKCGAEVDGEDYCPVCGESLRLIQGRRVVRNRRPGEDLCFGEDSRRDPLDVVELGLLLIIVGTVFHLNPGVLSEFVSWIQAMAQMEIYIIPPRVVVSGATQFFGLIGLSNFVTAATRFLIDKTPRRITSDILTGVAFLFFSYLINLHFKGALTWMNTMAYVAIVVGGLIIVGSLLRKIYSP